MQNIIVFLLLFKLLYFPEHSQHIQIVSFCCLVLHHNIQTRTCCRVSIQQIPWSQVNEFTGPLDSAENAGFLALKLKSVWKYLMCKGRYYSSKNNQIYNHDTKMRPIVLILLFNNKSNASIFKISLKLLKYILIRMSTCKLNFYTDEVACI